MGTSHEALLDELKAAFPQLAETSFEVTSPDTPAYNCIAWAMDDASRWWWPDPNYFWPCGIARENTVECFEAAFSMSGYRPVGDASFVQGVEKVALYVGADGRPTHAARQLPDGDWTSKLGQWVDIRHALEGLEGEFYGRVAMIFARSPQSDIR